MNRQRSDYAAPTPAPQLFVPLSRSDTVPLTSLTPPRPKRRGPVAPPPKEDDYVEKVPLKKAYRSDLLRMPRKEVKLSIRGRHKKFLRTLSW